MARSHSHLLPGLAGLILLAFVPPLAAQNPAPPQPARLRILVPAGAELLVDGTRTRQTGAERLFATPPLETGKRYVYRVKAIWKENGKEVVREETARMEAGKETVLDLRDASPNKEDKATGGAPAEPAPKKDEKLPEKPSLGKEKDEARKPKREPDIHYVPTPQAVVDRMLDLAEIKKGDVVYDLGCGDGRIVVTAAERYGVKAIGFDIDPERVKESEANVKKHKLENLVKIMEADIFDLDLTGASVVTLYLLPEINEKLMPQLAKLKPGSRIVSHDFAMGNAKPKKVEKLKAKNDRGDEYDHTIYLWVVPWETEK